MEETDIFVQTMNDRVVFLDHIPDLKSPSLPDRLKSTLKLYMESLMTNYYKILTNYRYRYRFYAVIEMTTRNDVNYQVIGTKIF